MAVFGRVFSIPGFNRNFLSSRIVAPTATYATLNSRVTEKLGLPPKPKRPLTPFIKFFMNIRQNFIAENPQLHHRDVLRKVAELWSKHDPKEKEALQKNYNLELVAYSKQNIMYEQSITPEQKKAIQEAKTQVMARSEKIKLKKKMRELGKPKKPPTAFIQFIMERKYNKNEGPSEASPMLTWIRDVADKWKSMTPEEKTKYQTESKKLMEQYRNDIREWEEKMVRLGHIDVVRTTGLIDLKTEKKE